MTVQEFNIFQSTSEAPQALPELDDVALVEVGTDGGITKLNSFGKTIWGWKKGGKIPHSLLSSLRLGKPLSFPISVKGRTVLGTGVQRHHGWLIVGYHEKNVASGKGESSYRTLIEKIPSINHSFLDQAPQGILFLDRIGNVIFANQQFRDCLHIESQKEVSENVFQLFGFDELLTSQIRDLLASGIAVPQEIIRANKFLPHDLRVNGSPVHDARNAILGAVLTFEILNAEEDQADPTTQNVESHHLAQLKNVFIAMMSHEIRTPLGVMNGYAEILSQELQEYEATTGNVLPAQIKEFVGAIHENAQRLLGTVNEMFDLSNMRQLRLSQIALDDILAPVAEKARSILDDKNVTFNVTLSAKNPMVMGDPKRLKQVFKNLLSNAVKFTQEGSVSLETSIDGEFVVIEVTDTGVGMSQEHLDHLFTPFVQEDTRINRDFAGTGLGLALAKLLVDLMHGRIEAESKKGHGSTFRVYLPAA
ncbi:MAG: ATP-binding protein [Rhodothermales bacterium]